MGVLKLFRILGAKFCLYKRQREKENSIFSTLFIILWFEIAWFFNLSLTFHRGSRSENSCRWYLATGRQSRCFTAEWTLFRALRVTLAPHRNSRKSKRREIRVIRILRGKTAPVSQGIRFIAHSRDSCYRILLAAPPTTGAVVSRPLKHISAENLLRTRGRSSTRRMSHESLSMNAEGPRPWVTGQAPPGIAISDSLEKTKTGTWGI